MADTNKNIDAIIPPSDPVTRLAMPGQGPQSLMDESQVSTSDTLAQPAASEALAPPASQIVTTAPVPTMQESKRPGLFANLFVQKTPEEIAAEKKALEEKKITDLKAKEEQARQEEARKTYEKGLASVFDLIAPASVQLQPNYLRLNDLYVRTIFIFTYPRYVYPGWLAPLVSLDRTFDIGLFVYPVDSRGALDVLRRRSSQVESALNVEAQKGLVRNPELETALSDIEELRERLTRGEEKLFHSCIYITIYEKTLDDLDLATKQFETMLAGTLIYTKRANFQVSQGFRSTLPLMQDLLEIRRNMNTGSLSTTFPFTSMDLTSSEGIMYGINRHNNSLIIFDRFDSLENANMVVFATAGAGKSYAVKLESLRYMMYGVDIIVIDPENEYKNLCEVVGGSYLSFSLNSHERINPFDIPPLPEGASIEEGEENLRSVIITAKGLVGIMLGSLDPLEDAIVDRALTDIYNLKGITTDPATQKKEPPLMKDLYDILKSDPQAAAIATRLETYVTGTFAGIFNKPTNINLDNRFIVFNIQQMEESLRPMAMYVILDYIWTRVRSERKKRLLVVDEAWIMMRNEYAAQFMYAIAKRARKYYLGLTTITQDIEDFMRSDYGRTIVTNSSFQLLLKQNAASTDIIGQTFRLTEGEKQLLLSADKGQGLFFAGSNHVAIQVVASPVENRFVTSSPKELKELEEQGY